MTVDDDDSDDDITHAKDIVQPPSTTATATATATDNQPSDTPFRRVTRSMTAASCC